MSKGTPQKQKPNRIVAGKAKRYENQIRERSSVWLERMPVTHEVASSSLVVPAIFKFSTFGCFFSACSLHLSLFESCNKVSVLRMTDGAIISGNRLV